MSESFLFALHSHTLIDPLLTDSGREHPSWISWQALTAVVQKVLQHSFADREIAELEDLITAHNEAFANVNEYVGLERPKHHFQTHLPEALRMFGPFRGFWCMPFEAFLQLVKKIINMGSFQSPAFQICHFWSMRSALLLSESYAASPSVRPPPPPSLPLCLPASLLAPPHHSSPIFTQVP